MARLRRRKPKTLSPLASYALELVLEDYGYSRNKDVAQALRESSHFEGDESGVDTFWVNIKSGVRGLSEKYERGLLEITENDPRLAFLQGSYRGVGLEHLLLDFTADLSIGFMNLNERERTLFLNDLRTLLDKYSKGDPTPPQ